MKKPFCRYLALLLCLLTLLSACQPKNPGPYDETTSPTDATDDASGTIGSTDTSDSKPTGTTQNPGDEPTPEPSEPTAEELEALRYSYEPVVMDEMPVIRIDTQSGSNDFITKPDRNYKLTNKIEYEDCTITVDNCDEKYALEEVSAQVKARGNYTLNYSKKGIRIKFNKKQNLLGLNDGAKCKSWVLFANWKDLSNLNNAVAFYMGNKILGSDGYFCTDFGFAELYVNDVYWGVYLVGEQHQVNKNRVDINEPEDGYTGLDIGYFVEYDSYYVHELPEIGGNPTFTMTYNNNAPLQRFNGSSATAGTEGYTLLSDIYCDEQLTFIQQYMELAYQIVYNACYNDTYYAMYSDYSGIREIQADSAREVVESIMDVQSLVDFYILQELMCDPDIPRHSTFISIDLSTEGDGLLRFECPWDFDSAGGIKTMGDADSGLYAANQTNPWILLVVNESWFQEMVREKWAELCRQQVVEKALDLATRITTLYQENFEANYTRWPDRITYGNSELYDLINTYKTQEEAANYLVAWLTERYQYLDSLWSTPYEDPAELEKESRDDYPDGGTLYRYEAEDAELTGGIWVKTGWNASGSTNGYVGNVSGGAGKEIIFTVTAEEDCEVFVIVGLSKREMTASLGGWFALKVNGTNYALPNREIPQVSDGESSYHTWIGIDARKISLKKGENQVSLYTLGSNATNVDYMEFLSLTPLS